LTFLNYNFEETQVQNYGGLVKGHAETEADMKREDEGSKDC